MRIEPIAAEPLDSGLVWLRYRTSGRAAGEHVSSSASVVGPATRTP